MLKRFYIGALASMVAMGVSFTLLLAELKGQVLACSVTSGCEAVLSSRYSHLFGVPLGVFGIAGFAWMLALFVLAIRHRRFRPLLFLVTSGGAVIALALVGLQAFELRQYCQYCLLIEMMAMVALACAWPYKNVGIKSQIAYEISRSAI